MLQGGSGRGTKGVEEGGEWGGGIPLPIRLWGLGERRELPSGVRGRTPAENEFGAFYLSYRTLLVEGKTNYFIVYDLSISINQSNKNYYHHHYQHHHSIQRKSDDVTIQSSDTHGVMAAFWQAELTLLISAIRIVL